MADPFHLSEVNKLNRKRGSDRSIPIHHDEVWRNAGDVVRTPVDVCERLECSPRIM